MDCEHDWLENMTIKKHYYRISITAMIQAFSASSPAHTEQQQFSRQCKDRRGKKSWQWNFIIHVLSLKLSLTPYCLRCPVYFVRKQINLMVWWFWQDIMDILYWRFDDQHIFNTFKKLKIKKMKSYALGQPQEIFFSGQATKKGRGS